MSFNHRISIHRYIMRRGGSLFLSAARELIKRRRDLLVNPRWSLLGFSISSSTESRNHSTPISQFSSNSQPSSGTSLFYPKSYRYLVLHLRGSSTQFSTVNYRPPRWLTRSIVDRECDDDAAYNFSHLFTYCVHQIASRLFAWRDHDTCTHKLSGISPYSIGTTCIEVLCTYVQ